jgi:hypothetical protein
LALIAPLAFEGGTPALAVLRAAARRGLARWGRVRERLARTPASAGDAFGRLLRFAGSLMAHIIAYIAKSRQIGLIPQARR